MTSPSPANFGIVIFRCHFRRVFAVMFILIGGFFTWMMLDALFVHAVLPAKRSVGFHILFGGFLLVALFALSSGVYLLWRPGLLHAVTDRGIVNYLGPSGRVAEPCFIPWTRIQSLDLVRRTVRMAGERQWVWCIKVGIHVDDQWPPNDFFGYDADEQVVYLDALSGSPSGRKLLQRMRNAHAQYGRSG